MSGSSGPDGMPPRPVHSPEETMVALADVARETWERVVARDGRGAEWTPKLCLVRDDGSMEVLGIVGLMPTGIEVSTRDLLLHAAGELVTADVKWLCCTMDAYMGTTPEVNERVHRGEATLRELHARGHPHVVDALFLHAVDRHGAARFQDLPYRVRGHSVHWLPPAFRVAAEGHNFGGALVDALRAVMTRAGN